MRSAKRRTAAWVQTPHWPSEAAGDVARASGEGERGEEVGEDVVVVAGVEGNVVAAGSEDGADDVDVR